MRGNGLAVFAIVLAAGATDRAVQAAPTSKVACRGDNTRVALLIGNQDYVGTMQKLENPLRDIDKFSALLCKHGFTVFLHADLDVNSFDTTVETFARAAKNTKTTLVYYSGHGFAFGGKNWLVPVDAQLACEDVSGDAADVPPRLERRLIDLNRDVLSRLEGAGDHIVILDACRVDPVKGCKGGATPSLIKGLVRTSGSNARLIVYATQDGQVALDKIKGSDTSPLVTAMLKRLPENPRRDWVTSMLAVSAEVHTLTERKQRPNIDVSLQVRGCLASECGPREQSVQPPMLSEAAEAWAVTKDTTSQAVLSAFIIRYEGTSYADFARARLDELRKLQTVILVPPVVPPSPPGTTPAVGVFRVLSDTQERALKPKDSFKECDDCPDVIVVPAGSFTMGSPDSEQVRASHEGPMHRVTFARQFAVGRFAVTFREWDACVADNGCNGYKPPDQGWGRGSRPVINVSWGDAKAYTEWLSKKTGKSYRLLSESEREYVARAGTVTAFWWNSPISTELANYDAQYTYEDSKRGQWRIRTVPVETFQANPWGLFQVHGNVWEWTQDCYHDSYEGAPIDGSAWMGIECTHHVLRGGSWYDSPNYLRSASRFGGIKTERTWYYGFRVARSLTP